MGARDAFGGEFSRSGDAKQRRIRGFCGRSVFADRLSQFAGTTFDIEDVVDDLEGKTKFGRVCIDGLNGLGVPACDNGAADGCRTNQCACLSRVHRA